jgi:hypothetical protein
MGIIPKGIKPPVPAMPKVVPPRRSYYDKMIYVAGAYGGSESNKKYLEMCCRNLSVKYPTFCFINGVSQFSHWYGKSESVVDDLKRCIALMKKCDEVWVMGETDWESSQGTMVEIFVAMENGIPVVYDMDKEFSKKRSE